MNDAANLGLDHICRSLIPPLLSGFPTKGPGFALQLSPEALLDLAYETHARAAAARSR